VFYEKTDERLTDEEAYIIWGINGNEKIKDMQAGMTFPMSFEIGIPESIFYGYFDKLENENIQELHIFGYSGENDQHINKRISNNKNIGRIHFYCHPENVNNDSYNRKIKALFEGAKIEIVFEPWDKIWALIL